MDISHVNHGNYVLYIAGGGRGLRGIPCWYVAVHLDITTFDKMYIIKSSYQVQPMHLTLHLSF